MRHRTIILASGLASLGLAPAGAFAADLDISGLALDPKLCGLARAELAPRLEGMQFRWVSAARDAARSVKPGLAFKGHEVYEVLIRFRDDRTSQMVLSLYNRGDAGDVGEGEFTGKVEEIERLLDGLTGVRSRDVSAPRRRADEVNKVLVWKEKERSVRLEYASSRVKSGGSRRVRPEYLNLVVFRPEGGLTAGLRGNKAAGVSLFDLQGRVVEEADGDVFLRGVPMVNQGNKGYCAVASAERVMRFYGMDVNQHRLAQAADTASGGGTDPDSLTKALRSIGNQAGLKVVTLEKFDFKEFVRFVGKYNRAAKKAGARQIYLPGSGTIQIDQVYRAMDRKVLVDARSTSGGEVNAFARRVRDQVRKGVPVLWSVMLGIVEERPKLPQAFGGHMRLIIGFNDRTKEILYSDSWGAGHEMKRMACAEAWAITTTMVSLVPN